MFVFESRRYGSISFKLTILMVILVYILLDLQNFHEFFFMKITKLRVYNLILHSLENSNSNIVD